MTEGGGEIKEKSIWRGGFTTGTCAAAAAKAAAGVLSGERVGDDVEVTLPDGARVKIALLFARTDGSSAEAAVRKDAGDDPDITNGATVIARVSWKEGREVSITAGEGVGVVTKQGLSVPPGGPAINPTPQRMIRTALREVTERGAAVVVAILGGEKLAEKTSNLRLGVVGGLSILGTTGRVRPYSCPALRESLKCILQVAAAGGVTNPVFVPGHIGERAARKHFTLTSEQIIELGNEWGTVLDLVGEYDFKKLLVFGHPGKLAKLPMGHWDTHSSRSRSASPFVAQIVQEILGKGVPESPTVEGLMQALSPPERRIVGDALSERIRWAVFRRLREGVPVSAVLVNLEGDILGRSGDLTPWL